MHLELTPEQEALVRTLRAFARKELAPRSAAWDKSGEFPWDVWRRMGELGLLGLRTPAAYGGQEADYVTFGLAMQEIARGDFGCTYGIQLAGLAGEILGRNAPEELKRRWLPPTARGEAVIALALTEPGVGSDAAQLACRAERDGEDGYVLTGEKSGISLAMAAQAAIVFARTGPGGAHGVTAFLVPLDLPGVSRSALRDMGTRVVGRAVLSFDHVRLPRSHRIGDEGRGFHQIMQGFDYNRVGIALACLGVADVSLEETMAYARERRAFGRPLAGFEGVSFAIAEAATQLEACRWHVGDPPDARSQRHALRRGYELSALRARQVCDADFERFDLILAMDEDNLAELARLRPAGGRAELRLFASRPVPDPYAGGAAGFEQVLDLVEAASEALARDLARRLGTS
jgi:cyclohexanecarboxyl-CoA dehydrogenase